MLFCVSQTSESYSFLTYGSAVGVSILDTEQRALSDRFASKVAFGAYDDVRIADGAQQAPLLKGALGHITAIIAEMIPSGDHSIVLCDVTSAPCGKRWNSAGLLQAHLPRPMPRRHLTQGEIAMDKSIFAAMPTLTPTIGFASMIGLGLLPWCCPLGSNSTCPQHA